MLMDDRPNNWGFAGAIKGPPPWRPRPGLARATAESPRTVATALGFGIAAALIILAVGLYTVSLPTTDPRALLSALLTFAALGVLAIPAYMTVAFSLTDPPLFAVEVAALSAVFFAVWGVVAFLLGLVIGGILLASTVWGLCLSPTFRDRGGIVTLSLLVGALSTLAALAGALTLPSAPLAPFLAAAVWHALMPLAMIIAAGNRRLIEDITGSRCDRCGYHRAGLQTAQHCPECNTPPWLIN